MGGIAGGAGGAGGTGGDEGGNGGKQISQPCLMVVASECHDIVPSMGTIPSGPLVPQYLLPEMVT
jgi:hypothetical protein